MKFNKIVQQYLKESTYTVTRLSDPDNINGDFVNIYTWKDGSYEYYNREGKLHRLDGPARFLKGRLARGFMTVFSKKPMPGKNADVFIQWCVNGHVLNEDEIEILKKKIAIKKEIQSHKNNRIDPGMLEDYL